MKSALAASQIFLALASPRADFSRAAVRSRVKFLTTCWKAGIFFNSSESSPRVCEGGEPSSISVCPKPSIDRYITFSFLYRNCGVCEPDKQVFMPIRLTTIQQAMMVPARRLPGIFLVPFPGRNFDPNRDGLVSTLISPPSAGLNSRGPIFS